MKPPSLKDNIHTILHGTTDEKKSMEKHHFYLADTPRFMREKGLTGDFFSARYGVIARHSGKDADHDLTEQNWINLCDRITDPFAIARHGNGFRLFTDVKTNDRNIIAGVDVKNAGKNLEVNSISTAFAFRNRLVKEEILYRSKKITPEQEAVLNGPDSRQYPPAQEAVTTVSPEYNEKSSGIRNKNNNKEQSIKENGIEENILLGGKQFTFIETPEKLTVYDGRKKEAAVLTGNFNADAVKKDLAEQFKNSPFSVDLIDIRGHVSLQRQKGNNLYENVLSKEVKNYTYTPEQKTPRFQTGATDNQLESAKKTGYVQGVCECVAAVGNDTQMAQKLLTDMKVTKSMAEQFAKPETYKALEQGVFAPKQEQQQQLSRGIKR